MVTAVTIEPQNGAQTFLEAVYPSIIGSKPVKTLPMSRQSFKQTGPTSLHCLSPLKSARFYHIPWWRSILSVFGVMVFILGGIFGLYEYTLAAHTPTTDSQLWVGKIQVTTNDFAIACIQGTGGVLVVLWVFCGSTFSPYALFVPRGFGADMTRAMNSFIITMALVGVFWFILFSIVVIGLKMDKGAATVTMATLGLLHVMSTSGVLVYRARQVAEARIKGNTLDDRIHTILWCMFLYPYIAFERGARVTGQTIANARLSAIGRHYVHTMTVLIIGLFAIILPLAFLTTGVDVATIISVLLAIATFALIVIPVHLNAAVHDAAVLVATLDILAINAPLKTIPEPVSPTGISDVVALMQTKCKCKTQGNIPMLWSVEGMRESEQCKIGENTFVLSNGCFSDVSAVVAAALEKEMSVVVFGDGICCSCAVHMANALGRKVVVGPLVSKE